MQKKEIKIKLTDIKAEIRYQKYQNFDVNTLLISFKQKHRIISTFEGYREVRFVANHYQPSGLSEKTMKNYDEFRDNFPNFLGIAKDEIAVLSTGANMNNLAISEKSFENRIVYCFATGGVGNALRSGVDKADWIEHDGKYSKLGTINIILVTNMTLSDGALARSIVTATEAKTAALQDMDARSSVSPKLQATGTGTDNVIVVSGLNPNIIVRQTGGHTKLGELIGVSTKIAVAQTIKNHEAWISGNKKMHIF